MFQGDSGGPLLVDTGGDKYIIAGVFLSHKRFNLVISNLCISKHLCRSFNANRFFKTFTEVTLRNLRSFGSLWSQEIVKSINLLHWVSVWPINILIQLIKTCIYQVDFTWLKHPVSLSYNTHDRPDFPTFLIKVSHSHPHTIPHIRLLAAGSYKITPWHKTDLLPWRTTLMADPHFLPHTRHFWTLHPDTKLISYHDTLNSAQASTMILDVRHVSSDWRVFHWTYIFRIKGTKPWTNLILI